MKFLDTLTLVLIAGILNSVIADGESPPEDGGTVPSYLRFLGYTNTTLQDIEKFDMELCEKNGGPNTHAAHKQSREQYDACIETLTDELKEERRNASRFYSYGPSEASKMWCRKVPQYENCVKPFTDSMKTCLDPEKHESADIIYNTVSRVLRFVCDDDAARLIKLTSRSSDRCIHSKSPALMECANHTISKYIQATVSEGAAVGGLGKLHLLVPNFEKCSVFEKFQLCVIGELMDCDDQTAGEAANSVFNIVKEIAQCEHFLKSHASPASAINVLLITGGMAMSLPFV